MSNKVKATILIAIGAFVLGLAVGQFLVFAFFDVHYNTRPVEPTHIEYCDTNHCLVLAY